MDFQMTIRNNKGVALVITLLVLTLLIVLILEFSQGMRVEARAAANFRDEIKAYYLARSGVTFAIAVLEDDKSNPEIKGVDSLNETWAQKLPPIPLGDGYVSVQITDEASKINVNKIATNNAMRALMGRFLKQFELDENITDAIVDWTDQGEFVTDPGGAESSYYESQDDSYEAKNASFDSLQELRLVKGLDNEVYNKVYKFLTIDSGGLINVNTASKEVLKSLSENIAVEDVDAIISLRVEDPFTQVSDLKKIISDPLYDEIKTFVDIKSDVFLITSTGEVNQSQKIVRAIVNRQQQQGKTSILYWRVE